MRKNAVLKVAAVTPRVYLADPARNKEEIIRLAREAAEAGADIIAFPEMCVTGATCGDLFRQEILLDAARDAVLSIAGATADLDATLVVGLPVRAEGGYASGAAILREGRCLEEDPRFIVIVGGDIPGELPEGTGLAIQLAASPEMVTLHDARKRRLAQLTYRTGTAVVYCSAGQQINYG